MSHFARRIERHGEEHHDARRRAQAPVAPEVAATLALQRSAGNAAVARRMLAREQATIVQHGEMSGDQFQIAAALIADPELKLYLIGSKVKPTPPRDKAQQIYDFYTQLSGIAASRVHLEWTDKDVSKFTREILQKQKDPEFDQQTFSVGAATNTLKKAFNEDKGTTKKVRDAWLKNANVTERELQDIVDRRAIDTSKPIAVLWSRQSGALGGLHPDLDSSYTGLGQLAQRFGAEGYTVMLVGDDPGKKIAGDEPRPEFRKAQRLGEFWGADLKGKPRTAQFAFFEHLRQLATTMVHVGMRSGNLEAYAYMGHRVLFLEEQDRSDAPRMEKLVNIDTTLKYRTVKLDSLPTRTGRALMGAPVSKLNAEGKTSQLPTEGPRFQGRNLLQKDLNQLKNKIKTIKKGTDEEAVSREKRALELLTKSHTTQQLNQLEQWIARVEKGEIAPHQMPLKEYEFLKTFSPGFADKIGPKGFSTNDVDRIIKAAKGDFWLVSVPEEKIAKFLKAPPELDKPVEGGDNEFYVLKEVREEYEKGDTVKKVKLYDLVRQPTPEPENPKEEVD